MINSCNEAGQVCQVLHRLREVIVSDRFLIPSLSDSVFNFHRVQYFTSLDDARGCYQLPLAEESKGFTHFSTAYSH